MGLFKKSYVEKLKDLAGRLDEASLSEDVLILKFRQKVTEIEEDDIEAIRLIKRMASDGHISEQMKRALLSQLLVLLRRLEKLKFEEKEKLNQIRAEIEIILEIELTAERIGIEVNRVLYHGSGIAGIKNFQDMEDKGLYSSTTLGEFLYCTDNKKMAINYAFYRYEIYSKKEEVTREFGDNVKPSLYAFRIKKDKNFIADLSSPKKLSAIYGKLAEFALEESKRDVSNGMYYRNFSVYLKMLIKNKISFNNFRNLMEGRDADDYNIGPSLGVIIRFLKTIGYHGLMVMEGGETSKSIFPWESSMSYAIFDSENMEIISEEHYQIKNGKLVRVR